MRKLVKERLVILCAIVSLLLVSSCATKPGVMSGVSYDVPKEMWRVKLVPATHSGTPLLRVTIDQSFPWPEPVGEPPQTVHYRITLLRPNEKPIKDVGYLTADDRVETIMIVSSLLAATLNLSPDKGEREMQKPKPAPEDTVDWFQAIIRNYIMETLSKERAAVADYEIDLVPYAGDRGLLRQEIEPKEADPPKYTWGEEVTDKEDPCKGKKPEVCALEKLKEMKERICNAKKPDGTRRFEKECELLETMLRKNPPEPEIACNLLGGAAGGLTDVLTGVIALNGEYLLTEGVCAEAALLHELQHVIDRNEGKKENIKKLRDAEKRAKKALDDGRKAKATGDKTALGKAAVEFAKAEADIEKVQAEAGRELIEDECRAFFFTIENGDFFGYPGKGNDWMAENIKNMVGELFGIALQFNTLENLPMKRALCKCFTKIRDWVNRGENAKIKEKLDKKSVTMGLGISVPVNKLIDRSISLYCE